MGRWILAEACRQTRSWQNGFRVRRVDRQRQPVGPADRRPRPGAPTSRDILAAAGLEPQALILEITESILVQDSSETMATLRDLKALGVRLAIDDFGTGYSSLSYLRQFPIDILKIDRSFVASLDGGTDSTALVRSIIELGNTLRLETVAEGIEVIEQRDQLLSLGTTRGQGYLFARPMAADALLDMLSGQRTSKTATPALPAGLTAPRRPRRARSKATRSTNHDPTMSHQTGAIVSKHQGSAMRVGVIVLISLALLAGCDAATQTRTIALQTLNDSGVTGTVSFSKVGDKTGVKVEVDPGRQPGHARAHPSGNVRRVDAATQVPAGERASTVFRRRSSRRRSKNCFPGISRSTSTSPMTTCGPTRPA